LALQPERTFRIDADDSQLVKSLANLLRDPAERGALMSNSVLAFVASMANGVVFAIDVVSQQVVNTIQIPGSSPMAIAITRDGRRAYVAGLDGTISAIDTVSRTVAWSIGVLPNQGPNAGPCKICVSPDGRVVYVLAVEPNALNLIAIDTITRQIAWTKDSVVATTLWFSKPLVVGRDGRYLYVLQSSSGPNAESGGPNGSLIIVDTHSHEVVHTLSIPGNSVAIDMTPDGRFAYVANVAPNPLITQQPIPNLSVVSTGIGEHHHPPKLTSTIELYWPSNLAISPVGQRAYAFCSNGDIAAIDTSTRNVLGNLPIASGASPLPIAVTPDGTYLCGLIMPLNFPEQLLTLELLFIDVAQQTVSNRLKVLTFATNVDQNTNIDIAIASVPRSPPPHT
jgi:DNA-binding beta-propeller fold protein YncE